jgi:hypothetical protein
VRVRAPALFFAVLLGWSSAASADDYRRPGLEGKWSRRHLTAPMNSLRILLGPGQPSLLGGRFAEQVPDGGAQFVRDASGNQEWWIRGGVSFGLTQDWEAGALFLPFRLGPDFDFSNITVFITRGFRFTDWDLGVRLSFQTPRKDNYDLRVWVLNPGIPVLYQRGPLRLDGAVLVPFATRDWSVGLTVPARATVSVDAHVFLGLESGFVEPRFDVTGDTTVPLGALAGYTALFGSRVVDFTAMFSWDSFWLPSAPEGSRVEVGAYRIGAGVVLHSLVR